MKKFSTAARLLVFASFVLPLAASAAQADGRAAVSSRCEFLQDAPDQHMVVRGDTLWGISGKFLQNPWCWPQVWGMNREQIRDPHWIYPGQVVYFDRVAGRLRLGNPAGGGSNVDGQVGGDVRLQPQQRIQGLGREAVPAIAAGLIEPFLSQPLIVEDNELYEGPRIVATQDGRVNLGKGDRAYVVGELDGGTSFQAFRPGRPLKDPETGKIIAYEATHLGTLKLLEDGDDSKEQTRFKVAHRFTVVAAKEEMGVGDRLMPVKPLPFLNYVPHPPAVEVKGSVISIYGGVTHAGQNQIVAINRGENDGMDIGTVLQLNRLGKVIEVADEGNTDKSFRFADIFSITGKKKQQIKLPDEQYGTLFIFRVFNNISYGLVMQVNDSVQIGDIAKSPE